MENADVLVAPPLLSSLTEPVVAPKITTTVNLSSSCPWGKINAVETVSLNDVMSEQLISSLVEEKPATLPDSTLFVDDLTGCGDDVTDCSDDYLLAKMLQLEFDKEHDEILKHEESKYNGQSKVKISYGKYRRLPAEVASSEDDDDKDYFLEQNQKNHWSNFEKAEKTFQAVGKSGVSRQGNVTTTKHDPTVCGRRNAGKLMELNSCISTGDGGMFDMKLSNNVYNTLRTYSKAESKRGQRLHEKKEKSTAEKALDEKTHLILYKLVNNQMLESLTGCISTGKEACVYHAWSGLPEEESPSPEFAIKVYKTTLNEFQNRDQYIKDDHRFRNRFTKQNPRKIIHLWAEKEMRNLIRMKEASIPCPDVVVLKKHVLVMSFIGKNTLPAPKLKDVESPFEDLTIMFEQTVEIMKTLYSECRLVHADLSEYNLLWHEEKVWVIDVSQAIETTHSRALEFLLRDCTNITSFFQKSGVLNVPTPEDLFFRICGKYPIFNSEDLLPEEEK
ncbi:serine/threonine-protein kinase RIO3-like [Argiope bruennichi]|uniref:serine/threonine-protein kinase RIO3-like n=1 Tax=Argiope bruennichi TaxID=94029 RepID=UPI00249429A1|nr:serine/threonine-protein kinase RIO3-like [Argiope bruennichi]XP_055944117.1 serine/threonine-protein kinase RIO3-like [Argiope bruennichi]XP_055944118.1 serine/threonine-protein kinase RIO3-like [Argiope bruennichi]XP_055944119.1 serine/threonine-protein kinase RIO3-like [Argiope bruennichi]